jgi:hypothetical protein
MANELDTGNSAGQLFENITQSAQFTMNENALLKNLVTMYDMTGTPGLTASVPVWPKVTGLAALSAGADLSNTDISATAVDITAAEYGAMTTIQDIVIESSPIAVAQDAGSVLGAAVAQAMDEVIVDLFGSASTDVGPGAGNPLTMDHILKAAATLRRNSVPMQGIVAVLSPAAAYNLKKTLVNTGGSLSNNDLANAAARDYYLGTVAGVAMYESASIDIDGSDDAISAVFHPAAIGMVMKRDLRIATQRDESIRGFEVVSSAAFGAAVLDQAKIVKMTSDSTL